MRRRFDNSGDGLVAMLGAVSEFVDRVWVVEGANGIGRSIAQQLVAAGENRSISIEAKADHAEGSTPIKRPHCPPHTPLD